MSVRPVYTRGPVYGVSVCPVYPVYTVSVRTVYTSYTELWSGCSRWALSSSYGVTGHGHLAEKGNRFLTEICVGKTGKKPEPQLPSPRGEQWSCGNPCRFFDIDCALCRQIQLYLAVRFCFVALYDLFVLWLYLACFVLWLYMALYGHPSSTYWGLMGANLLIIWSGIYTITL